MSEWQDKPSHHLHTVPVHAVRRQVTPRQIVALILLTLAIVAVPVVVIWHDQPASSAARNNAAAAAATAPVAVPTSRPGTAVPTRKPVEKSPPIATSMPKDGTYLVGRQIKTGTYTSPGPDVGRCYWARLKDTTGEMRSVIAASYKTGQQIVTIRKGDRAFVTDGCGPWELMKP